MTALTLNAGDRVAVRDRAWIVTQATPIAGGVRLLALDALDREEPRSLKIATPPEDVARLPAADLAFDLSGLTSWASWIRQHRLLATSLVQASDVVSGARHGRVELQSYQLAPVLRVLAKPRPSLLIADDVGLGKTIEAGLVMLELIARRRAQRILVVAPPGLLHQWASEMLRKVGLAFTVIEDSGGLADVQRELPSGVSPWDALPRVLTSMEYVKREPVRERALRKRWDLVVVDEAHALAAAGTPRSSYSTQRTRLGRALRERSRGLLLLTATPHNGYEHSFRSLVELVEPSSASLLGTDASLARRVNVAMLRRMKSGVMRVLADGSRVPLVPPRTVDGLPVAVRGADAELLRKVASYCSRTARASEGEEERDLVTFAMQVIKKRALSSRRALALTIDHRLDALKRDDAREEPPTRAEIRELQADLPLPDVVVERRTRQLVRCAVPREERRRNAEVKALNEIKRLFAKLTGPDPKIEALVTELRGVLADPAEKVIVFTEYLDTLHAIAERLEAEPAFASSHVVLRGGMSGRRRDQVQVRFEAGGARLLLATDAASEGLNLQKACRRVVHVELPWNPNRLEQRNGRVDRYGQERPTFVRYLYYPDSPEDDVLHQLVTKIGRMQSAKVSTPDILGIWDGATALVDGLVALDPEAADVVARKRSLVVAFEDRTAEFVRDVQPLLAPASSAGLDDLCRFLGSAVSISEADDDLEELVRGALGAECVRPTATEGVVAIDVPARARGPGVRSRYAAATFRRNVATATRPGDVEYVTPLHPLVQALATQARRQLAEAFPDEPGRAPLRLGARRLDGLHRAAAAFTWLVSVDGQDGVLEETIVPAVVDVHGAIVPLATDLASLAGLPGAVGETTLAELKGAFEAPFARMALAARERAREIASARTSALAGARARVAATLRAELETDTADRLREIDLLQSASRGPEVDQAAREPLLPFETSPRAERAWDTRRAAALAWRDQRQADIAAFESVNARPRVEPLGAVLLLPPKD